MKIWREAFNDLLQNALNIRKGGQLIGVQLRFNACYEARQEMLRSLFHRQIEINKRQNVQVDAPRFLEISCLPRYFLRMQTLEPLPFFTSTFTWDTLDSHSMDYRFCFLPTAFTKIVFDSPSMKRHGTYLEWRLLNAYQCLNQEDRHWPLRALTYILRNLELFPSLKRIEIITSLYPALVSGSWWISRSANTAERRRILSERDTGDLTILQSQQERDTHYFLAGLVDLIEEAKRKNP